VVASAPRHLLHSKTVMDDNKATASVLMLVAFGAMWTTVLQALAEIFANLPGSQTTRGRTRHARHPPPPPPPVLIQYAEGPIAQPSLSAGRRLLFQFVPNLFWELFWLTTTPQMVPFVILADHQAPWQLWSHLACPATWPSADPPSDLGSHHRSDHWCSWRGSSPAAGVS